MPIAPLQQCATIGCRTLVARGHCPKHQPKYRRWGKPLDRRYSLRRWTAYSRRYRAEHPWCALCRRLAECVDHIIPVTVRPDLFWDPANHQSLCRDCNNDKRDRESATP